MSALRRATLLFNPTAGQRRAARALPSILELLQARFDLAVASTESPQAGRQVAQRAIEENCEVLFALGGDGTLNVLAEVLAGSGVALAPLPGGTTNVVALALGLPRDPLAAARTLADGAVRELDLGEFRSPAGGGVFLMQLSGGLDAEVMAELAPRAKRRFGKLAVAWSGVRVWARYRFPAFALAADGERFAVTGFVVANLAEYAGGFAIVPGARADDRQLELLLFRGRSRRAALGFALALARGSHTRRRDVEIRRVATVRLLAPAQLRLQRDGDPFLAAVPCEIALAPRGLRVLAPAR
jgi:diacylglycerol kinase (ATP)